MRSINGQMNSWWFVASLTEKATGETVLTLTNIQGRSRWVIT